MPVPKSAKNRPNNNTKLSCKLVKKGTAIIGIKVIDTETNIIYDSVSMCQKSTNYKKLQEKLSGKRKNLTPIVYLKDYNNNSNDIRI